MSNFVIEKVNLSDADHLQKIGAETFREAFSDKNSAKDMDKYISDKFTKSNIQNELENADSTFYFAKIEEDIIGYLKLNYGKSQTDVKDPGAVEIERIYVLELFHGKWAGQALLDKAIQVAGDRQAKYIWLGVWEENPRAIRFYEKNDFVAFDKHVFVLGSDEQTDIVMKLEL